MSDATSGPLRRWGQRGTAGAAIPARLCLAGVGHDYGGAPVLRSIDLDVAPGAVVCLLGPSGCGKTTLLRLAAGVETPARGRITLDEREVAGPDRFVPPEERGVGLMFQDYALFPHLTVRQNVLFGLRALSASDAQTAAIRALSRVGMQSYVDAYPHMLSGGEQQRVALARAVAPRPGVILMDEPFSNLDRRMRDAVREETVALLREMGATTVIVTHDPEEAMRIADRVVLMRRGEIVQAGTAVELYRQPVDLAAARFFCDFNETEGVVRGGRADSPLGIYPAPHLPDGPAVVCVRPQAIRLRAAGFCLPGRVLSRRFLGEVDLLEIAVQGVEAPLRARLRSAVAAKPGQDVGIDIDADEVLVFAASAS
ncbi:MAG: ABC transporter ATP-binding protein [Alsobacter sp.]